MGTTRLHRTSSTASSSGVQAYAARSLDLLRAIETTLLALDTDTAALIAYTRDAREFLGRLQGSDQSIPLDPDRRGAELFRNSLDTAERVHAVHRAKRAAAAADASLTDEDGIVEAFDALLDALAQYHDAIQEMAEFVATHDALLSPVSSEVFADPQALLSSILAKR